MNNKTTLGMLIVLNMLVLLGQLWPEGAPPFARIINIITLIVDIVVFSSYLKKEQLSDVAPLAKPIFYFDAARNVSGCDTLPDYTTLVERGF